ncbi:MAG TPA: phospholipid carrier-dependent glycosyltransferase [Solirubrobacteraceae bacterium]|nr:phospholipid carrier-dependent glycosyltransferase [Solirubrobacteraceae bacterium]
MTTIGQAQPVRAQLLSPAAPLLVLALIALLSLGARSYQLGQPCQRPCTTANDHTLIFDEAYYVNAARVIADIRPPAGSHYDQSPLGTDPNAEHPQGAKLIMAGAIELFGDGPFAWRIGSVLFGTLAILAMYALARAAGAGRWTAVGAAGLMAADNLMIVSGRIGTLDIYALAPMLFGVACYLRGRLVAAMLLLALADCMKEVAPYALIVLGLLELGRVLLRHTDPALPDAWRLGPALRRFGLVVVGSFAGFILGLWVMGLIATPYADSAHQLITGGPFAHLWHIITYAEALTAPHGATGIASYPWQWLFDKGAITYLGVSAPLPGHAAGITPVCRFLGEISPPIIALAIPALLLCLVRLTGIRGRCAVHARDRLQLSLLALAWFLGTWGPYQLQSALEHRISYLYYMISVMPGIYLALALLASTAWRSRRVWLRATTGAWVVAVVVFAVLMYPFVAAF